MKDEDGNYTLATQGDLTEEIEKRRASPSLLEMMMLEESHAEGDVPLALGIKGREARLIPRAQVTRVRPSLGPPRHEAPETPPK